MQVKEQFIIAFELAGEYAYQNVYRLINSRRKYNDKELILIDKIFKQYENE